ncbi:MAG: hypothetical protein JWP88_1671 [Flaviaesturariibacter sp.]|nr:hypothetical protein [Flaviaesturariibacter sp.]
MYKIGIGILLLALIGCGGGTEKKKADQADKDQSSNGRDFSVLFSKKGAYSLTDTGLLANKDTVTLQNENFVTLVPDSIENVLFGSSSKIKYTPLACLEEKGRESYYIVKAVTGAKKAALLMVFDKKGDFSAALPFLVPDADPSTTQVSTIDKSFSITRSISRKQPDDVTVDGKDVFIYNEAAKSFTLIITDALDNAPTALINPIDTLQKTQPFSGDYIKDQKNIVSIRDSRNPKELNFFIHFEKDEDCTGELKGTALLTSSKTAVFRQGGNPCNVEFTFSSNSVTIKEIEGCGSFRGIKCFFEGKFPKKKAIISAAKKEANH